MGLDKTPDLASIEERARQRWEATGIYGSTPSAPGEIFSDRHAAAVRLGRAPARRPRDVVRAGGVHRPLPAHARPQRLLSDGLRRQRAADRALRRAEVQDQQGPHDALRVPRALPRGDGTDRRRLRAVLAQARALGRLAAALLDDRRPLPSYRADVSFLDLFAKGRIYRSEEPVFWDPSMQTSLAQADLETITRNSTLSRHRVPGARRPRPRDLDDTTRAASRVVSRCTSIPRTSGTPRSRISRDRADQRPRGADPLRRGRAHRLRHRPHDGVHLRRRRRRAAVEARRPRPPPRHRRGRAS